MRAPARLLVLAATLLSWPAVPGPAAHAESGAGCYALLNAARARAGVPAASASTLPALARAAANHAAYRVRADLGDLPARLRGHVAVGRFGPDRSAHEETRGLYGYTGRLPWDRTRAAGLRDSAWRSQAEDVTTSSGAAGALPGVQGWVDAPYHRLPLLDANNRAVGCGSATRSYGGRVRGAEVLEMASTWGTRVHRLTRYPAPGQTGVPLSFDRRQELPSPFATAAGVVGYVVSLQADGWHALKVGRMAMSKGPNHTPVAVHRAVRHRTSSASGSLDGHLPDNAAMLAAARPLQPHTRYRVRISGYVQATAGGQWHRFRTRVWSFTTR